MSRVQRLLRHWPLFVVLLFFLVAKLYVLSRFHYVIWDEAVYVGMGKYIASFGSAGLWEQFRPPLLPLIMGFFWKLGLDPVFWGEFFIIFCSAALIVVTYILALQFSRRVASLSVFLLAFSPLFFLYSNYLFTHIPAILFVVIAVLVPSSLAKGCLSTVAALFRFPVGLALFFHRWRKELFIAAFLVAIPYFFVNILVYKEYSGGILSAAVRPLVLGAGHQDNPFEFVKEKALFYVSNFAREFPLLLVFLFVGCFLAWRSNVFRFFIVFALYYHLIPNRQDRFALEFLPFMAILASVGIWWYLKRVNYNRIVVVFLFLVLLPVVWINVATLNWRTADAPVIVREYASYFESYAVDGAVLTADPLPAAYSNALFIPYYYYPDTVPVILNEWERDIKIGAVIWAENAFPCMNRDCEAKRSLLYQNVSSNKKVFSASYPGKEGSRTYEIFLKNDS